MNDTGQAIVAIAQLAEAPVGLVRHCIADVRITGIADVQEFYGDTFIVPDGKVLVVTRINLWTLYRSDAQGLNFTAQELTDSLGVIGNLRISHNNTIIEPATNYHACVGDVLKVYPAGTVKIDVAPTEGTAEYTLVVYVRLHGFLLPAAYEANLRRFETRRL
jgi:hypothetical protein